MSESKWTPGPWSLEFDDVPYDGGFETLVINSENGGICMMDCPQDDMDANGRLIAAAPDLYDALKEALRWIGSLNDWEGAGDPDIDEWRAVIAKAKGENHD